MRKALCIIAVILLAAAIAYSTNNIVVMRTNVGDITIELFNDRAPVTVQNFLRYVDAKFYDGTLFHRVIGNFMIQGGGFIPGLTPKYNFQPIVNEASNGLQNKRGTIAIARTNDVNSATSQFFINVMDNPSLDFRDPSPQGFGYCVFGRVIQGMDVVDRIRSVPTKTIGFYQDVPVRDVVILSVIRK